jgi:hypothetical protein
LKTEPQVLKCILAVNLNVNIWTAKRKLQPEDFKHSTLPPQQLASLGNKRICDPKALRVFTMLKARAVSLLDKSGVRFLGGWAVPESKAAEIVKGLEAIADEFKQAKDSFMSRYDQAVQSWIAENPGWEQLIAGSVVSADYVAKRIAFNWQVFKVVNPTGRQKNVLQAGLQNEVNNLGSTLFDEVAKVANEAWQRSYLGKTMVTRKALSPLKNIQQKLSAIDKLPGRGSVSGTQLLMLQGLLVLLTDTGALTKYAQEILDGRSHDDVLSCLVKAEPTKKKSTSKSKAKSKPESAPVASPKLESLGLW